MTELHGESIIRLCGLGKEFKGEQGAVRALTDINMEIIK